MLPISVSDRPMCVSDGYQPIRVSDWSNSRIGRVTISISITAGPICVSDGMKYKLRTLLYSEILLSKFLAKGCFYSVITNVISLLLSYHLIVYGEFSRCLWKCATSHWPKTGKSCRKYLPSKGSGVLDGKDRLLNAQTTSYMSTEALTIFISLLLIL